MTAEPIASRGGAGRRRWLRWLALVLGSSVVLLGVWAVRFVLPRATGYAAKIGCSAYFVTGRSAERIAVEELADVGFVSVEFDADAREVRAGAWGLAGRRARYAGRHGCVLGDETPKLVPTRLGVVEPERSSPWPSGDGHDDRADPAGLDRAALDEAIAAAFDEFDPEQSLGTRAVVVAWQGRLLGERYGEGVDYRTPLPGWSMAKSLTNAIVGLLVGSGELDIDARAPIAEWHANGDPRRAITLDHLLRMSSGLEFDEEFGPLGEGSDMLFVDSDAAERAIGKSLVSDPGTVFSYSSGTANIVGRIIRDRFADADAQRDFVERKLFEPLGIHTAVLELDRSGSFVASSFAFMSGRDWARLGQLYLDDGMWSGRRILPRGWVEYTVTPAPACEHGEYGALFQTNAGGRLPSVPTDAFEMVGYQGQSVLIVPSRHAVIVRLGLTRGRSWDTDGFAATVLAALPP